MVMRKMCSPRKKMIRKVKVQKYVCGNCKKDLKRSDNLRRHVKSVHKEEKGNTNKCKGCKKLIANK